MTDKDTIQTEKEDTYKQALDEIRKYCVYMRAFNECNKTNKGLDVDEVLDIINKTKEIK